MSQSTLSESTIQYNVSASANKRYSEMFPHGRQVNNTDSTVIPKLENTTAITVAAIGFVNSAGQILVGFNRKRQVWDVPQGVAEKDESTLEAAYRELTEELNISKNDISRLVTIATFAHKTPEFIYPWKTELFLAEVNNCNKIINNEVDKCEKLIWVAPSQMPYPRGLSLRVMLELLGR